MCLFYKRHQVNVSRLFSLSKRCGGKGAGSGWYFCLQSHVAAIGGKQTCFSDEFESSRAASALFCVLVQLLSSSLLVCSGYSTGMVRTAVSVMVRKAPWSASLSSRPAFSKLFWLHTLSVIMLQAYLQQMFIYELYTSTNVLIFWMLWNT